MKLSVWACTNKVGSKSLREIEIDDEELEGMTEEEREKYIDEYCQDEMRQMIEWGWSEA